MQAARLSKNTSSKNTDEEHSGQDYQRKAAKGGKDSQPVCERRKAERQEDQDRTAFGKNAQQAAKAAQKTAQATAKAAKAAAQAAKAAAKAAVTGIKVAVKATAAAIKATIAAIKGLIALIAAGGWVAVVIILLICLIALIVGSCFGLVFRLRLHGDRYQCNAGGVYPQRGISGPHSGDRGRQPP